MSFRSQEADSEAKATTFCTCDFSAQGEDRHCCWSHHVNNETALSSPKKGNISFMLDSKNTFSLFE